MNHPTAPTLPTEIWLRIIESLPIQSIFSLSLTNRFIHNITIPFIRLRALFPFSTPREFINSYLQTYGAHIRVLQLPLQKDIQFAFDDDLVENATSAAPNLNVFMLQSSCSSRQIDAILSNTSSESIIYILQYVRRSNVYSLINSHASERSTITFGCCDGLLIHPKHKRSHTLNPAFSLASQLFTYVDSTALFTLVVPETFFVDSRLAHAIVDYIPQVRNLVVEITNPEAIVVLIQNCRKLLSLRVRGEYITSRMIANIVGDVKSRLVGIHMSSSKSGFFPRFWHFLIIPSE